MDEADEIADLKRRLREADSQAVRLRYDGPHAKERDEAIEAARAMRKRLFELTGDAYGGKTKPPRPPPDDALNAEYLSPGDVPADVMAYERQRSVVTSDATDAQRWARIVDTLDDERLSGDVTLYRATEDGDDIRPGDWVTLDRAYAEEHNRRWLDGRGGNGCRRRRRLGVADRELRGSHICAS